MLRLPSGSAARPRRCGHAGRGARRRAASRCRSPAGLPASVQPRGPAPVAAAGGLALRMSRLGTVASPALRRTVGGPPVSRRLAGGRACHAGRPDVAAPGRDTRWRPARLRRPLPSRWTTPARPATTWHMPRLKWKVVRQRRPTENLAYALRTRVPEPPSMTNDRHQQQPANMKLEAALNPRATDGNTLVMCKPPVRFR